MFIERPPKWFRWLFPGAVFRLPAPKGERPRVYITFDDGPIPEATPWVLDTLDRFGVKATFFMVGQNVERHPELLDEVRRRGHSVGNHTLHHIQGASARLLGICAMPQRGRASQGRRCFGLPTAGCARVSLWP